MFRDTPRTRAVSEVISFVLVFSIIASTVAFVSLIGFDTLVGSRDAERVENAERAFDVLADNVDDIHREGAPSRATEIKLSEANLRMGETTTVKMGFPSVGRISTTLRPIVFSTDSERSKIVYEAGAVLRVDDGNAVMLREPPMRFDVDRTTVTYVKTIGDGAVGGDTTVLVRAIEQGVEIRRPLPGSTADTPSAEFSIRFETTEARDDAWLRYFESEIGWVDPDCSISTPGVVECSVPAGSEMDELFISESTIDVQFD